MTIIRHTLEFPTRILPVNQSRMIAYARSRRELWAFGGFHPATFAVNNELWRWQIDRPDLGWKRVFVPGTSPDPRSDCLWVWDPVREHFVMSGGADDILTLLTDTWTYDPAANTWTDRTSATPPAPPLPLPRFPRVGVYDEAQNKIYCYGGFTAAFGHTAETQELDPVSFVWSTLSPSTSPPARALHWMAYDPTRGKSIVFGGEDAGGALNDTWIFDGTDWTEQESAVVPPARRLHMLAYHPRRRGVMLGLGTSAAGNKRDLWLLNVEGWRQLYPSAPVTEKDLFFGAACDALGAVAVIGGQEQGVAPFPAVFETYVIGRDEEWAVPQIGWQFDEDEITVDGGATLTDPSLTASSAVRRLALAQVSAIESIDVQAVVPADTQVLCALIIDGVNHYFDGSTWVSSNLTPAQRNTIAEFTAAAAVAAIPIAAPGSSVGTDILLVSDNGVANPMVQQVEFVGDLIPPQPVAPFAPRLVTILGTVRDEAGQPVAGAKLRVAPPAGGYYHGEFLVADVAEVISGADGRVSLQVYETETVAQALEVSIDLGAGNDRTASVQIPDRDPIQLEELLP